MIPFENATAFFHACETGQGWAGCRQYVADSAPFSAQCEPISDIDNVEDYTAWMQAIGTGPLAGANYVVHASAWDEANHAALFFATLTATHNGEGGPVPPTGKQTVTDYVYVLKMDDEGKVAHMTKVWNAPWCLNELGWT